MVARPLMIDGVEYRLVSMRQAAELGPQFERLSPFEAVSLVRQWDRSMLPTLMDAVDRRSSGDPRASDGLNRLIEGLGQRECATLALYRRIRLRPVLRLDPVEHAVPLAHLADEPQPESLYWVEVELLDEEDLPVSSIAVALGLAGGRSCAGRTDDHGVFRFDRVVKAGDCTIGFPGLERCVIEHVRS